MKKSELIDQIKHWVGEAEFEQALQRLLGFLDRDPKYRRLSKIARKTQALLNKTKGDERRGIISFDNAKLNYNIVSDSILQLLNNLEQNELNPPRYAIEKDKTPKWQLMVSILTLVVLLAGLAFWMFNKSNPISTKDCPAFEKSSEFNVLLLPFDNLDGTNLAPHKQIKKGLADKIEEYQLQGQADVEISERDLGENNAMTTSEAQSIGWECEASLVMWGSSETVDNQKEIIANYKLIKKDRLDLDMLQIDEEAESIQKVKRISGITADGLLTKNVDLIIRAFFGLAAHEMGNYEIAIENLQPVANSIDPANVQDSSALMMIQTTLADSYINTGQSDMAIAAYDKVLERHPGYKLANNNKAILLYQNQQYEEAIPYLNNVIQMDTSNWMLRKVRADSYYQINKLDKAQVDYKAIQQKEPSNPKVNQRIKSINKKMDVNRSKASAGNKLIANYQNLSALQNSATANRSIGNYGNATRDASKILKLENNNWVAHNILIEAALERKDTTQAKKRAQQAIKAGVPAPQLYRLYPFLKPKLVLRTPVKFSPSVPTKN